MRAVIYTRVSTDEQASEGFSLKAQEARSKSFIESQGWTLTADPYIDDGYSAKDLNRPAIQQLLQDLKEKKFDVLVVYRLDRLVRSVLDLNHLLQLFEEHNVKFKSVTEVFDTTTATGRLFINLVASVAQWERENLAERVLVGQERKALEGKRNGATAPYGYKLEDGKLVIHPEEAKIVREIFDLYRLYGMWTIAKKLNQKGIPTQHGMKWGTPSVKVILTNPVYCGNIRWNYRKPSGKKKDPDQVIISQGDHEPIISEQLFEDTQRKMEGRQIHSAKALTSDYPFSSVLSCPRCGAPVNGMRRIKDGNMYYYYFCSTRKNKTHAACNMPSLSEKMIEEVILNSIPLFIEDAASFDPPTPKEKQLKRTKEDIEKDLAKIKRSRAKWLEAYRAEAITIEELKEKTQEENRLTEALHQELNELSADPQYLEEDKNEFIEQVKNLRYSWDLADRRERKEIIQYLFKKIVLDIDETKKRGFRQPRPLKIIEFELN